MVTVSIVFISQLRNLQDKMNKVLQQFSRVCMTAIVQKLKLDLEEVIDDYKSMDRHDVATLLKQCSNETQVRNIAIYVFIHYLVSRPLPMSFLHSSTPCTLFNTYMRMW